MVTDSQNNSTVGRGWRLGKLGLGLVGSYLSYQAQNLLLGEGRQAQRQTRFRQKASRRVREELGALKGPAMKLGQMLSMQADALPEEAMRELVQLQMQAPAMHGTLARAQFKGSLGKYPEEIFREFDAESFAAASLGQVHRATTHDGEKVAVKIQYPGIKSAIESDFKLLRSTTLPTQLSGHVPRALLDEVERGLLAETDYRHEVDNLEFFRQGLSGLNYLTIPRVRREWSTDRVLTMSYVEGGSFDAFLQRKPSQELRDQTGTRLVEMYEMQLRCLKTIHADHHPGNYLFRPDGAIGLVDFGCVKHITFDVRELRRGYQDRVWRQSEAAARSFLVLLYGRQIPFRRARRCLPLLDQWADLLYPRGSTADVVVDYRTGRDERFEELAAAHWKHIWQDKLINPEHAFLVRADMGLFHLLGKLRVKVNFSEVWRRVEAAANAASPRRKP
jgi:predicted unusual protein kinase regulating ubiquinone biosynthesis (AarF/ABC1/UbiB family)